MNLIVNSLLPSCQCKHLVVLYHIRPQHYKKIVTFSVFVISILSSFDDVTNVTRQRGSTSSPFFFTSSST